MTNAPTSLSHRELPAQQWQHWRCFPGSCNQQRLQLMIALRGGDYSRHARACIRSTPQLSLSLPLPSSVSRSGGSPSASLCTWLANRVRFRCINGLVVGSFGTNGVTPLSDPCDYSAGAAAAEHGWTGSKVQSLTVAHSVVIARGHFRTAFEVFGCEIENREHDSSVSGSWAQATTANLKACQHVGRGVAWKPSQRGHHAGIRKCASTSFDASIGRAVIMHLVGVQRVTAPYYQK